jgi:eukaryotic-like serine/threonine-protein kinase
VVPRPRSYKWLALLCVVVAAGAAGLWWMGSDRRLRDSKPTVRRLTSDAGLTAFPTLSTDGKLVAYASDRSGRGDLDIWIQAAGGREAIRLTDHEADDYDPHFSPDNSQIVFRSDRDAGGIYLVSVLGGQTRLLARGGRRPRFSPDGRYVAYSEENINFQPFVPDSGRIHVIASTGGPPQQLQPQFTGARGPIWSSDGKHVLFVGVSEDRSVPYDWWISPVPQGKAIQTGVLDVLRRSGLDSREHGLPYFPAYWAGNNVVFSARSGDSVNLWQIAISPKTWRVAGIPQRLTFGAGPELQAEASRTGAIAFTNAIPNLDIWALPVDAELGRVTGSPRRLTNSAATDHWASVTADGKKVLFSSTRSGKASFWLKNLESGSETELATTGSVWNTGTIGKDAASFMSYSATERAIQRWNIRTGDVVGTWSCHQCIYLGHLPDGSKFLYGKNGQVNLREIASGRDIEFLKHPKFRIYQAQISGDGRWVAFYSRTGVERSQIFVAPFVEGVASADGWIPVTPGNAHETCPTWSPEGNVVYFGSNRDGFNCIWGQRLDRHTKRPVGPPVDLGHFHSAARRLGNVGVAFRGLSVARDKIVFTVEERIGNLWLMQ